jgi:hypothetical protein
LKQSPTYFKKRRKEQLSKGECPNHVGVPLAPGKTKCQYCIDYLKKRNQNILDKGKCFAHPKSPVAPGKIQCQVCLDWMRIRRLPKNAQEAALKKAQETEKARTDGTYVCPIWGKTEKEINEMFPSKSEKSVWEFDHVGDIFRDIISGPANRVIGTLSSKQLSKCLDYVKNHEI